MGRIRKLLFQISPREVLFARRGFEPCSGPVQARLERVGQEFLAGYHAAMECDAPEPLARSLALVEAEFRGFAYEGAAMALVLLDRLMPGNGRRFHLFLQGPGAAHAYMAHVGAGWAVARLPWLRNDVPRACSGMDPLLRWLLLDGYGFHEGYFHWPASVSRHAVPRGLSGYAARAFDQGLGRSLWFVGGADVERIASLAAGFAPARHGDLYAGLGLACAYAGGMSGDEIHRLCAAAGPHLPAFAQGVAFAARARQRAGNPTAHTELVCREVWRLGQDAAAAITGRALEGLPSGDVEFPAAEPAYEAWRMRIQREAAAVNEVRYELR